MVGSSHDFKQKVIDQKMRDHMNNYVANYKASRKGVPIDNLWQQHVKSKHQANKESKNNSTVTINSLSKINTSG